MIRGLIVDAGGVLIRSAGYAERRAGEAARGRPAGFLDDALREAVGPGWAGGRSEAEIDSALVGLAGVASDELAELHRVLGAHEELDEQVANLVRQLRPRCHTAVLANAGPQRRAVLVDRFGVDRLVDLIVISAEEGVSKPDPRVYELTARRLGLSPGDCLFVDDSPENVRGAVAAGMVGVLFRDHGSLADELQRHVTDTG